MKLERRLMRYWLVLCGIFVYIINAKVVEYEKIDNVAQDNETPELATGDTVGLRSLGIREQIQNIINIPLPKEFDKLLDHIDDNELKNINFARDVLPKEQFETSYAISGDISIDLFDKLKAPLQLRIITAKRANKWEKSVELNMPENWKIGDMLPKLKNSPVGAVPLPDGQIIFATFDYTDEDGFTIKKGANIAAHVNLEEVAPELHKGIDKLRPKNSGFAQSIVFEGFDHVRLNTHIGRTIADTSFDVVVPLRIGVDFEKLHKEGVLKRKPSGIRKITTGNIVASFEGGTQEMSAESGLQIYPTTQQSPLDLRSQVQAGPNTVNMVAKMDGTWDPAITKWLALHDPAFELNFDYSLMAELAAVGAPVPFTGLKIRGGMDIGPKNDRTQIDLASGIEVSDDPRDLDFAMIGSISKIDFKQLTHLFARIVDRNIPDKKVPPMQLTDVKVYVVPKDMKIADRAYEAGMAFGGGLQVHKFKGNTTFEIDTQDRTITADGYLEPIKIGKALEITGKGPDGKIGTDDDRSRVKFLFPPRKGVDALFEMDGIVRVPVLNFENEATVKLGQNTAQFDVSGKLAGVSANLSGNLQMRKLDDTELKISVQTQELDAVSQKAVDNLKELRADFRKQLDNAQKEIDKFKKQYEGKVKQERRRIENDIRRIRKDYEEAKKSCDVESVFKKPFSKDCWKQGKIRTELLVKEKIYKDFLLKEGEKMSKVVSVPGNLLGHFKKIEAKVNEIGTAIANASQIKDISGRFKASEIKQGQLPDITITLKNGKTYTMKAVTKDLATNIAQRLLSGAKK